MNYGKFFRLNKHLSRIEDGFAIYDYIDLPAYFTPSKDNLMSPKYPISVIIMGDSVVFKLHYSAYKIEKVSKQDAQDESIKGYSNYPQYIYNIEAPSLISENKVKGGDTTKIVHMEEIILELPFTDTVGRSLSDTIRDIYDTQFPLIQRDHGKDSDLSSKEKSSGGRYLEKLIRTRYLEEKVDEVKDVNSHFYESLRKISDGTASYSTLWLMGLVKGDKNGVRYRRTDKKGNVIGFLRKLLLDFMFDLKHSDVFQNSVHYQKMYSGLMSDFYFSALMHKCEYYYYRKLTSKAIEDNDRVNKLIPKEQYKKEIKKGKETIASLYASELIKAEDLWIQDIMNPQAGKEFEHQYPGKYKILREIFEIFSFQQWQSWFAEPEEEMRRVCFTMKENSSKKKHICNADTLIEYFKINNSKDNISASLVATNDRNKELISRWFLKRYDFNDVAHLHIVKHFNLIFVSIVSAFLIWLFGAKNFFDSSFDLIDSQRVRLALVGLGLFLFSFVLVCELGLCYHHIKLKNSFSTLAEKVFQIHKIIISANIGKVVTLIGCCLLLNWWSYFFSFFHSITTWGIKVCYEFFYYFEDTRTISTIALFLFILVLIIYRIRCTFVFQFDKSRLEISRTYINVRKFFGLLLVVSLLYCAYEYYSIYGKTIVISILIAFFGISYYNRWFGIMPTIHPISSLHLLFPRLVAAVTAGWLTMSLGFDIYVSFFDSIPRWYTAIAISGVVFIFIMYEINRIMPASNDLRKIFRSFEFLIISYCISLLVGVVVINFVGEKFLERGGYIGDYYEQHVDNKLHIVDTLPFRSNAKEELLNDTLWVTYGKAIINRLNDIKDPNDIPNIKKVENLQEVTKDGHKIVEKKNILGFKIYFMHDFLIMFSFIAMFWGIFIQMIFTGEKQMTEL